ncbi:MAG TPA: diaminopimelate epimerase [Candidatus Eisenbacteria bacterium]|nr:diaminopimelate epimerase [Candidatus Eisenbacteria bacterium]
MSVVPFVKATACGNDFLIIGIEHAPSDIAGFTRQICDRHNGVGADGVEWVQPATDADLAIRLINADGSEAEISGNGTRCVAAWFCAEQGRDSAAIRTDAGVKTCDLMARVGRTFEFRTCMGQPEVGGEIGVPLSDRTVGGILVSMGNPHFVVFVREFETGWQRWASEVAVHPQFSHGTNVELVRVIGEHEIEVRFCERGVGETMSSGTGSSASAAASIHAGRAKSPVRVHAPGGTQTVEWDRELRLYGPATILCRGDFFV